MVFLCRVSYIFFPTNFPSHRQENVLQWLPGQSFDRRVMACALLWALVQWSEQQDLWNAVTFKNPIRRPLSACKIQSGHAWHRERGLPMTGSSWKDLVDLNALVNVNNDHSLLRSNVMPLRKSRHSTIFHRKARRHARVFCNTSCFPEDIKKLKNEWRATADVPDFAYRGKPYGSSKVAIPFWAFAARLLQGRGGWTAQFHQICLDHLHLAW